ncbi:MAG: hypothetical protein K0Q76_1473 [Panacagrimonas sp.]|nr:FAD-dependent oxidoreductase [Panacagrimonas sp.]MCC2656365.1 hypothetical protein [Panacagrimonas sp.]
MTGKTRVAILGGGVGAISAAYQLTSFPGWQDRFEITLYQMGWRLGGKCASGRNADHGQRIEEHGLHIWHGFYDNAIRQMRDCYAHAGPMGGVFRNFDDAFDEFNNITLTERVNGQWRNWFMQPPRNSATPGSGGELLTPWEYCGEALRMLRRMFDGVPDAAAGLAAVSRDDVHPDLPVARSAIAPEGARTRLHLLLAVFGEMPKLVGVLGAAPRRALLALLDDALEEMRERLAESGNEDDARRRFLVAADLVLAAITGAIQDEVVLHGFDAIDDQEITAWLRKHGASEEALDSALVCGIYDYAFGFRNGIAGAEHRAIAAGTSLRGLCRMTFTYKGSYFYKMRGGMGDTVFTPYYKVLRSRGVKFRFFHKVTGLEADAKGERLQRITIQRQADLVGAEYDPLVPIDGPGGTRYHCWPSKPRFAQLAQGAELDARNIDLESSWSGWNGVGALTLEAGRDFDKVILGIPIGALREISTDLRRDPRWADMLDQVQTTRTMACQLWMKSDLDDLGWEHGPTVLCAFADDLNTWADMSHLLPLERWPRGRKPKSVAYFCGPMADDPAQAPYTDTGYPARERDKVRAHARQWIEQNLGTLWPAAGTPCWDRMQSAKPCDGDAAFEAQYFRANIDPSERYVLSVPGSTQYRLRSDQSGFANLFLAGDWTHNGINAGCVEAAVMSGMRAAAGLAEEQVQIVGESDGVKGAARNELRPPDLISLPAQNQSWPWSAMYGMAQTSGASALIALPREIVQSMLEPGLTLAPQDLTPATQHPVLLLFGWQSDVRPNRVPFGGGRYMEFIVSVPFVQHRDARLHDRCPGPFIYMPRLFLDQLFPTLLGIWGYGYNKSLATIRADQRDYTVFRRNTQSALISASYQAVGATGSETDFPHFSVARKPYGLPLISRTLFGSWHYSFYDFALGQALIQPIEMTIKVYSREVGGLPPGTYTVPSIQKQGLGAFFITTDATISNPLQSPMLAAQIRARSIQGKPPLLPFEGH